MTEKRLIVDEDYNIVDTLTGEGLDDNQIFDLVNELNDEINVLDAKIERLIRMLDNVANYMQKQNKNMPLDDFVEWWNKIATEGLDD